MFRVSLLELSASEGTCPFHVCLHDETFLCPKRKWQRLLMFLIKKAAKEKAQTASKAASVFWRGGGGSCRYACYQ